VSSLDPLQNTCPIHLEFPPAYSKNNASQNKTTKLAYNATIRIAVAGRSRTKRESLDDTIVRDAIAGCRNERLGQCQSALRLMTNLRSPNTVHRKYVSCGDGDVMGGTMQNFDITAKRAARRLSVRCSARSIVHGCEAYLNVDRNVPSIEKANRVAAVEMEIASRSRSLSSQPRLRTLRRITESQSGGRASD
jgi:hypothetical protein